MRLISNYEVAEADHNRLSRGPTPPYMEPRGPRDDRGSRRTIAAWWPPPMLPTPPISPW